MYRSDSNASVRFLVAFCGTILVTVSAFAAMLLMLKAANSLPAPPLTGTSCIDEKFRFLAHNRLDDVDFIAVGSSVTWRNIDVVAFEEAGLARRALNAAPCYLQISQTAFLSDFLLKDMAQVSTVLAVVAPRDFEECGTPVESFFSEDQAKDYIFGRKSPAVVYAANFRPVGFVKDAWALREAHSRPDVPNYLFLDAKGAGPLLIREPWLPAPRFDDACFAALREMERLVEARGATLIVASFPMSPDWRKEHDPDGTVIESFEERIRGSLSGRSLFISHDVFSADEPDYADGVHLMWSAARRFSDAVAQASLPLTTGRRTPSPAEPQG